MGALKPFLGLLIVALGVLVFVVRGLCGLTENNALLFAGLALVVGGMAVYVVAQKRQSKY